MPRREEWRKEAVEAIVENQRQKEREKLKNQEIKKQLAEKRARETRIQMNAESRVKALMAQVSRTRNGFIWTGKRIQFIDPALFSEGNQEKYREEYETAVMVEEMFLRNLGYNRKHYYISSARNGISIHWQGNWFENGCEYCILEV